MATTLRFLPIFCKRKALAFGHSLGQLGNFTDTTVLLCVWITACLFGQVTTGAFLLSPKLMPSQRKLFYYVCESEGKNIKICVMTKAMD